jgi:AcrR family transcriptional regulator
MDKRARRPTKRRGPGRRPAGSLKLDRATIIARGLELAKDIPLHELSIVRVAHELGVTPAMIHYHLDGRDDLTSGVVNLFVGQLLAQWPRQTGRWQADLREVALTIYRHFSRFRGISAYFVAQNRFQILLAAAEKASGPVLFDFLERYFSAVRGVGLSPQLAATYGVLLIQFVHTTAYHTASHHWPGEQAKLASHLARLDRVKFPNISALRQSYLQVAGDAAFEAGLALILRGIAAERRTRRPDATTRHRGRNG